MPLPQTVVEFHVAFAVVFSGVLVVAKEGALIGRLIDKVFPIVFVSVEVVLGSAFVFLLISQ